MGGAVACAAAAVLVATTVTAILNPSSVYLSIVKYLLAFRGSVNE